MEVVAAALIQGLEHIMDQSGYLVICNGVVLASAGNLENDNQAVEAISELACMACTFHLPRCPAVPFHQISVVFGVHFFLVTITGQKLFVVRRQNSIQEPVTT
ncbi:ragulator complex protein LAMTOR4-like [Sceloporus undulatus]|uniref:ragulator complex protein LAMTOR4-like n=1 Tax=Sceloporus undulatus TaxID=8520 RepID=UPI001C4C500F|nr:ragulator complex protein LAMTOR4-like [Sceloporus undulatus]